MTTLPPHANNGNIPNASGVYKITCTVTKKVYLGSTNNLRKRKKQHFDALRRDRHENPKLQNAWNKYGEQAFIYEIVELVLPLSLTAREQYWFKKLNPFGKRGFNIARDAASPPSSRGRKRTPDQIEALRKRNLGNTYGRGRVKSPEEIEQIRQRELGNKHGLGNKNTLGRKLSPEHIEILRQTHLGKEKSPAHREKIRQSKLGVKRSPEVIEKVRQSLLGRTNASQMKTYILTDPDGVEYVVCGISPFCREHALDASALVSVAKGKCKHHKGWKARYHDPKLPI